MPNPKSKRRKLSETRVGKPTRTSSGHGAGAIHDPFVNNGQHAALEPCAGSNSEATREPVGLMFSASKSREKLPCWESPQGISFRVFPIWEAYVPTVCANNPQITNFLGGPRNQNRPHSNIASGVRPLKREGGWSGSLSPRLEEYSELQFNLLHRSSCSSH